MGEARMEVKSYTDWSLGFHERFAARRIPLSGSVELTRRCNLSCLHCYNNLPANDAAARAEELTTGEHRRIMDEIAEAGCLWLLLTGGEIFLRKDFRDIYDHAKQRGFLITLFTNGTLIDRAMADYLAERPPFSIEVSLYGLTRETHERVTRVPGSYDRCREGIRLLAERGLPLLLKTMVMRPNRNELWKMKRFAENELGVDFRFDAMINPRIDDSPAPLAVRLSPSEVVELDVRDPRRATEWVRFCEHFSHPPGGPADGGRLYDCGGARNAFAVDPAGRLGACVLSRRETYDLRGGTFREGWGAFLHGLNRKEATRRTRCTDCGIRDMCGMCPANGEIEGGDAEAPVDFLCRVAHLRAYALGIPVPPHGTCEYCKGGKEYPDLLSAARRLKDMRNEG